MDETEKKNKLKVQRSRETKKQKKQNECKKQRNRRIREGGKHYLALGASYLAPPLDLGIKSRSKERK